MTGGILMFLSAVLLVNKFHFRLAGSKKETYVVEPSYVQDKRPCYEKYCFKR